MDKKAWWTVRIFKNKKELRTEAAKKCLGCGHKTGGTKSCLGLTHSHSFKSTVDDHGNVLKGDRKGELGLILLCAEQVGCGVVSHEMTHAMMYTATRYGNAISFWDPQFSQLDEWCAGIVGSLVNCFYNELEKINTP